MDGALREVVVATQADVAKLAADLAEGVYVVGTGSTGAAGHIKAPFVRFGMN